MTARVPAGIETKSDLIASLKAIRAMAHYGLALDQYFATSGLPADFGQEPLWIQDNQGRQTGLLLDELVSHLKNPDPENWNSTRRNLRASLCKTLLREGYEHVLHYCAKTNQVDVLKRAPFYQYLRLLRNTLSHRDGIVVREWPKELARLTEISWEGNVIRKADTNVKASSIPMLHVFDLYDTLALYAFKELR